MKKIPIKMKKIKKNKKEKHDFRKNEDMSCFFVMECQYVKKLSIFELFFLKFLFFFEKITNSSTIIEKKHTLNCNYY